MRWEPIGRLDAGSIYVRSPLTILGRHGNPRIPMLSGYRKQPYIADIERTVIGDELLATDRVRYVGPYTWGLASKSQKPSL